MQPKDVANLKRQFPRRGFVEQWNQLEQSAKDFSKELLGKAAAKPSAAWKLLVSYKAEPVLWLAFSSKNAQVKEKFNNFFNVWPEARQKIPTTLMAEMRITPDLPNYGEIAEMLFFEFMDGKLQSEEEIRKFLEPHSPPAPPPPVVIRRPRGRRAEPKIEEDEEIELPVRDSDEEGEEEEEDEVAPSPLGEDVPLPPKKGAAPVPAKGAAKGAKAAPAEPVKAAKEAPKTAVAHKTVAKVPEKVPAKAAAKAPARPEPPKTPVKPEPPKASAKAKVTERSLLRKLRRNRRQRRKSLRRSR